MLIRIGPLAEGAVAAAAQFHSEWLPRIEAERTRGKDLVIAFSAADHTHRTWRLALVQGLARKWAPLRVNSVAGDAAAVAAAEHYLAGAPGVTGQYLELDGAGAGNPAG